MAVTFGVDLLPFAAAGSRTRIAARVAAGDAGSLVRMTLKLTFVVLATVCLQACAVYVPPVEVGGVVVAPYEPHDHGRHRHRDHDRDDD